MKYYVAYGSNMNVEQMSRRCPGAVIAGRAFITGHTMRFRAASADALVGVAGIEPRKGCKVPALVWSITAEDELALDRYEGFPFLYRKETLPVKVKGKTLDAMVYIMTDGHGLCPPSVAYYRIIAQGYTKARHDPSYLMGFHFATIMESSKSFPKPGGAISETESGGTP